MVLPKLQLQRRPLPATPRVRPFVPIPSVPGSEARPSGPQPLAKTNRDRCRFRFRCFDRRWEPKPTTAARECRECDRECDRECVCVCDSGFDSDYSSSGSSLVARKRRDKTTTGEQRSTSRGGGGGDLDCDRNDDHHSSSGKESLWSLFSRCSGRKEATDEGAEVPSKSSNYCGGECQREPPPSCDALLSIDRAEQSSTGTEQNRTEQN